MPDRTVQQTIDMLVILDAIALIMMSLGCYIKTFLGYEKSWSTHISAADLEKNHQNFWGRNRNILGQLANSVTPASAIMVLHKENKSLYSSTKKNLATNTIFVWQNDIRYRYIIQFSKIRGYELTCYMLQLIWPYWLFSQQGATALAVRVYVWHFNQ